MGKTIHSIRTKLIINIAVILLVSLLLMTGGIYLFQKDAMNRQAENDASEISSFLKTGLKYQMLTRNVDLLQSMLDEVKSYKNVRSAFIINAEGVVKFSTDSRQVGLRLDRNGGECLACHSGQSKASKGGISLMLHRASILRSCNPIYNEPRCYKCHSSARKVLGMLSIRYSTEETDRLIGTTLTRLFITALSVFIVLCLSIIYFAERWINRPIYKLIKGTEEIKAGNYENRITYGVDDEFRILAESFNDMSLSITRNIEEIKKQNFELSFLYNIVKRISEAIYVEDLKIIVVDLLLDVLSCEKCLIITPSSSAGTDDVFDALAKEKGTLPTPFIVNYSLGEIAPELHEYRMSEPLKKWSAQEINEPELYNDSCHAYIPLIIRNNRLGLIVAVRNAGTPFDRDSFRLLAAAKEHLAIAFENARLYTMAITDELTKLFTLRYFKTQMERQVSMYRRYGQKFSLLMLDIDKFKIINDTYGHPAGDIVLKEVADTIKGSLRQIDIPCRYGGEEFAVILPETSEQAALVVAERIRGNIEKQTIEIAGNPITVTISIGGSSCPLNGKDVRHIVSTADKALYRAKDEGRNNVRWG